MACCCCRRAGAAAAGGARFRFGQRHGAGQVDPAAGGADAVGRSQGGGGGGGGGVVGFDSGDRRGRRGRRFRGRVVVVLPSGAALLVAKDFVNFCIPEGGGVVSADWRVFSRLSLSLIGRVQSSAPSYS